MWRRKTLVLFLLSFGVLSFEPYEKYDSFIPLGPSDCEIIHHNAYVLCYNEKHEQANWVSYMLTGNMCSDGQVKRSNSFYADQLVTTGSALPDDYKGSGYDRGHLCPAGDMKFSEQAMKESFFMSNMSPQVPAFNRGIWKKLEEKVRTWAIENKTLFITTGGLLQDSLPKIGAVNKISVPHYFYKVILDNEDPGKKAIGFLIPNCKSTQTIFHYATPIDSLEKITGLDFFSELPDSIEAKLESEMDTLAWK